MTINRQTQHPLCPNRSKSKADLQHLKARDFQTPIHIILGKRPPPSLAPNHHVRRLLHIIHTRVDGTYTYTLKRRRTFHFHLQLQPSYPYIPKKYVLEFKWPTQHVMDVPTLVYKEQTKQAVRTFFMKRFKMAPSELWKYQKHLDLVFKNLKLRR